MATQTRDPGLVAVLGLGRFGQRIAKVLARGGLEVIACDRDREVVEQMAPEVAQAVALDVTDEGALRSRGIHQAGTAIVAIGEDFEAAVLATVIARQMEIPRIIARARSRTTGEVLRRVGAHDVVLAEDEAADRWANRVLGPRVLNQIEFHEGHSIVELRTPEAWVGRGPAELGIRRKYGVHIVAVKRRNEEARGGVRVAVLPPDEPLREDDVLIVMGQDEQLRAISKV